MIKIKLKEILFCGIIVIIALSRFAYAETGGKVSEFYEKYEKTEPIPYDSVEVKPLYKGGPADEFRIHVAQGTRYPMEAAKKGIQGKVLVSFVIDETGKVGQVKVLKRINPYLDAEAKRVISTSPRWTPGQQNGVPVPVLMVFPVVFKINNRY